MKHNADVKISEKAHRQAIEAVEISYPIPVVSGGRKVRRVALEK